MEASKNFILNFKRHPKIVKAISAHSKSTALIFSTFKKIIHFVTIS
jgi:hypothetical protein